jgi:starvation-inducible DNA-binding protein
MIAENSAGLSATLNTLVADFFALYVKTKNFHWHMNGPHFRDYHLLLDDQGAEIFAAIDPVAERVRKIGQPTLTSIGDIVRRQTIADNDTVFLPAPAMLFELYEDNLALVANLRAAKALADEAGDNATSALIDGWTDEAERRAWFLGEATRGQAVISA